MSSSPTPLTNIIPSSLTPWAQLNIQKITCTILIIWTKAFAPLAFNFFGQHGPEALCYQWIIAGKLAQRICPVPTFDLPDSVATHCQEATHSKWLASSQRLSSKLFWQ
jgi:hypothetical protein